MPQLRPLKLISSLLCLAITVIALTLMFHRVYLPRVLSLLRIRTYFLNLRAGRIEGPSP